MRSCFFIIRGYTHGSTEKNQRKVARMQSRKEKAFWVSGLRQNAALW